MVIDAAKGIEPQTLKLFEVCRLRSVPIITFINKVDREGLPPFELLDEVADRLALDVCPMNWPAGMGGQFEGIYELVDPALMVPGKAASRNMRVNGSRWRGGAIRRSRRGAPVTRLRLARKRQDAPRQRNRPARRKN